VEKLCTKSYADGVGRPGIPPGVYFRMLFIGNFEGLGSDRAIACRCADSLSLRGTSPVGESGSPPERYRLSYLPYFGWYSWTFTPPGIEKCVTSPKPWSWTSWRNSTPFAVSSATVASMSSQ
jgi:hypothetical protein